VAESLTIPARFNGPPETGNGGYTCGRLAALLDAETAVAVSLRVPPPLERPLAVVRHVARAELHDGETLVAEAAPSELSLAPPEPVPFDRARAASDDGREQWTAKHPFPTCFVCGPDRDPGDGLRLFPGRLEDSRYAVPWTPDESVDDGTGHVRAECVWAALDCPTSAPVASFGAGPAMVLASLTAQLNAPVKVGEPHSILSWPLREDGRKRHAAAALFDADGRLLGASLALWIELRQEA
jgi:hypothetical protein